MVARFLYVALLRLLMSFISVQQAIDKGEGQVSLRGWIHRERGSNKLKFIVLRDSSNIIQVVCKRDIFEDWSLIDKLSVESSIEVTGTLHEDARAPTGYELRAESLTLVGESHEYPITRDMSVEHLANNRHLWLRSRKMMAMLKIRSTVFTAIRDYFLQQGFIEYHSPIFQAVQCEGGSELFEVNYFDKKDVFLTQTWQLYAEPAIFGVEKIFTIAPTFRAEKSLTARHLTEFWMAEMEMAWASFSDIIGHGEGMVKHIVQKVLKDNVLELSLLERDTKDLENLLDKPFIQITYTDALAKLKTVGMNVEWGKDLRTLEEEKLCELYDVPVVVTHYPKKVKAFYMTEDQDNPDVVHGCDFLVKGIGEILGGSHREHDLEKIKQRLIDDNEDPSEYEFYLDTRRYGSVPHGGFGLGTERVIRWICGFDQVKDCIAFPRTPERYKP